jgi:hypothetical protein
MTNLVLIALSLTLAAEPSGEASPGAGPPASKPAAAETAPQTHGAPPPASAPEPKAAEPAQPSSPAASASADSAKPGEPATAQPAPTAAPALERPAESEIEVLGEVVDLEASADPTAAWYGKGYPERIRILALPTARTVRKGGFELVIDHRASSPIYNKDSQHPSADMWNKFLGLDSTLAVGLGLRFGILDRLDAGLYRASSNVSTFDTYEFDARFGVLRQGDRGLDLMLRAGLSWFVVPNHADALWPFAQIFASRLWWNRLLATVGVMYHANSSPSTTSGIKYSDQDHRWSVAGAAGIELRLASKVALDAEVVPCLAGYCAKRQRPAFSGGVKFFTARHTFALVCGNTQFLTADGYITNTDTPWSKLVLGFNITREY